MSSSRVIKSFRKLLHESKEQSQRRLVIEQIISAMSLGVNLSPLFADMVKAAQTTDLVQKKMIYLYICKYAEENKELLILSTGTFQRDCQSQDPLVRGLSLRSMSSLMNKELVEYMAREIKKGLMDRSNYVRRIAVLATVKLFRVSPELVLDTEIEKKLYSMIAEVDPYVSINSVVALNEILASKGGISITQKIIIHLLKRFHEFTHWGQSIVLGLVANYAPQSEQECLQILNLLDNYLKSGNTSVILSVSKVFINLINDLPNLRNQIYDRIKNPLITLVSCSGDEMAYPVLKHIYLIATQLPNLFANEASRFFIKGSDPTYLQEIKIDILCEIVNKQNFKQIIFALASYVINSSLNEHISSYCIRAIGKIASQLSSYFDMVIDYLMEFIELDIPHIVEASMIILKDVIRLFPEQSLEIVLPELKRLSEIIHTEEAKVSLIWILGEYGEKIDEGPYILEKFVETFSEESSEKIKLELLTSVLKMFFKRPPESKKMLGVILHEATENSNEPDVIDRGLFYYRLISTDINKTKSIVLSEKESFTRFTENDPLELFEILMDEFNTFSVVYKKPYEQFKRIIHKNEEEEEEEDDDSSTDSSSFSEEELLDQIQQNVNGLDINQQNQSQSQNQQNSQEEQEIELEPKFNLEPSEFQNKWMNSSHNLNFDFELDEELDKESFEEILKENNFQVMASGLIQSTIKIFCYGKDISNNQIGLFQLLITGVNVKLNAKGTNPQFLKLFAEYIATVLTE
ncbi:ap-4 complex subunit beta-1 [Anaeramoeba flamelloides]|uniref:AP complex subunit beta n=1 Tax=Anaeramoeba flamelloides TaxID=1746091 RepID=A0AAV7ZET4_9EUKA|nr:ap-4 complex subunit beta-1 [Anaeramoeba flamelloides]